MAEIGNDRLPIWNEGYDPADDDDDNADETTTFFPNGASTPAPEFQTEQKEKESFIELNKVPEDILTELADLPSTTFTAEGEINKEFPNADKNKIKFKMDGKGRTEVGLINPKKPYYRLLTEVSGKSGEYRINPKIPKEVLRALGQSRRQTIETEIQNLTQGIIRNKKIHEDETKDKTERKKSL